ncbi:aminotransferase class I/II-fold pyridoxal phosphate-dependent enzyme [Lactobacillus sp. S2-2]|uniref:aminotransferase class I/II-fold pyridoxal phosphate-dependent enzyme n=1 Tax=Lactobacillus sp. S2-2 TaxID=2692917 RepID=UPI001F00E6AF|nr:aminotransferase class I/II-fold pyridoxal phosphate-dependent enzyme [Lactobacillus sp. S2-2]MCF6514927.1 aminotransferase class I/II-fold pyridoxal phosphate-dependent enzyme [Lactobacillus sp. S2-2]
MPNLSSNLEGKINKNLDQTNGSMIRSFSGKISNIEGIIKLTVGEPGLNTPEHVKKAAMKSIEDNHSHYSLHSGIQELREAISSYINNQYGLNYDPNSEIITTVGATESLSSSMLSLINPGDEVLIPLPAYPLYTSLVQYAGGIPVYIDTTEDGFVLTKEKLISTLDSHPKATLIVLNYPNNPTGAVLDEQHVKDLAEILSSKDIFVISDEIYSELTYDSKHVSFAKYLPEQTIFINGLSKSHAMTGYRLGYIAAPKDLCTTILKIHGFLVSSPSNPAQYAGVEALVNGIDDPIEMNKYYEKNRDLVYKRLSDIGFSLEVPRGAFYAFAKIPDFIKENSYDFALDLAKKNKVGVTPGIAFGEVANRYIRISYATDFDSLQEGLQRIEEYVKNRKVK